MPRIIIAETDADAERCFPVMAQLRPHVTREEFPARVRRQRELAGYQLVFLEDEGAVRAAAGFRVSECLASGKFMYVDDLVTAERDRSKGYGGALFDWLVARAKSLECDELHLDSGVQRFAAHRFYLLKRMEITCHHFEMKLKT